MCSVRRHPNWRSGRIWRPDRQPPGRRQPFVARTMADISRKPSTETLGTALLLSVVIGSGIMAQRFARGHVAIALRANTLAAAGGLYVLIEVFGPVSGAHFDPAVSLGLAVCGAMPRSQAIPYIVAPLAPLARRPPWPPRGAPPNSTTLPSFFPKKKSAGPQVSGLPRSPQLRDCCW